MRVNEIMIASKFIADLKLSKFDKGVRLSILKNYIALNRITKEFESKIEDLRKKMFDDKQEEAQRVQRIRECMRQSVSQEEFESLNTELQQYKEFLELEADFINIVNEEALKNVKDVEITLIDRVKFMEGLIASGVDITPRDIDKAEIMFSTQGDDGGTISDIGAGDKEDGDGDGNDPTVPPIGPGNPGTPPPPPDNKEKI